MSRSSPRVSASSIWSMCESTKKFFFMFALHMCSGRPVVADCRGRTRRAICVPSPIGSVAFEIQLAGLLDPLDQLVAGNLAQHVARPLRLAHVALQQAAVGLADLGDRLAGDEVHDLVDFQRVVRLAPAQDRECSARRDLRVCSWLGRNHSCSPSCADHASTPVSTPHRRRLGQLVERPHAADAVPRIFARTAARARLRRAPGSRARRIPWSAWSASRGPSRRSRRRWSESSKSTTSITARGCGA